MPFARDLAQEGGQAIGIASTTDLGKTRPAGVWARGLVIKTMTLGAMGARESRGALSVALHVGDERLVGHSLPIPGWSKRSKTAGCHSSKLSAKLGFDIAQIAVGSLDGEADRNFALWRPHQWRLG